MIIDYSKTVIYKIFCKDLNITDIYIGSTTNFNKRKIKHKSDCYNENKKSYNLKVYQYIRENGGFENFEMVIIEEYPSDNKKEANKRERFWIEKLKANLNIIIPTRTKKERYINNINNIKEKDKEYRIINKEKIRQDSKDFYENNKDKIKERHKKHYENNKEYYKEYHKEYYKEYYLNNKNIFKEKFNCECGGCYTKPNKNTHYKTKIHQEYLKNT
jgi:hypothetical protein